jgi:dihydrodipicolinate synthase/N-acetylneuraminate lyase
LGTPLNEKNELHEDSMRQHVHSQIAAGVSGLLCLGSMGMAQMHTPEVREQAIRATLAEAKGKLPVLVGCGDCSTARTLQYLKSAERYSPDGIVLVAPYFPRLSEDELHCYFAEVAAETKLPIYLYDIPYYSDRHLTPALIESLARSVSNIVGLKASGELTTLRNCIEHFWDDPQFTVLSGHSNFLDQAVLMGADGIVDGLFALAPQLGIELFAAASSGKVSESLDIQRRLFQVRDVISVETVLGTFSHVMNLLGFPGKFYCAPLKGLSENGKEKVEVMFHTLRHNFLESW